MARRTLGFVAAAIGGAFFASAAVAADMVVIQAAGAPVEAGDQVDGSAVLTLPAGASVTLLSASGAPVTLSGPFEGAPGDGLAGGDGDGAFTAAISNMFRSQAKSTASLGAIRSGSSAEAETPVPQPWLISVADSGDRCIYSDRAILWRSEAAGEASLTLTGGVSRVDNATWPAGADQIALPSRLFADGKAYVATIDQKTVNLTVHKNEGISNPEELVAWMAERGCTAQAMALLNTLR